MLQHILVMKTENSFESRCLLAGNITQHCIHWWRINDLIWIENVFRIPGSFYFFQQAIIFFTHHLFDKLTPQSSIAMFSAKWAIIFFYQCGYLFCNSSE